MRLQVECPRCKKHFKTGDRRVTCFDCDLEFPVAANLAH